MVKRSLLFVFSVLLLVGGCQSTGRELASLPPPTFDGPKLAPRPALPPITQRPTSVPPTKQRAQVAGVPRGWTPSVRARNWQYIVIHHSATDTGGASAFDRMHRNKGWDELGYHFVVGNGTDSGDGVIEVGSRWSKQKYGAHAKTPDNRFNDFGIGICLVGNFDAGRPSAAQMRALAKLIAHLMQAYDIPADRIVGHGDVKPTECPGRHLNLASVRQLASQALAESERRTQTASAPMD